MCTQDVKHLPTIINRGIIVEIMPNGKNTAEPDRPQMGQDLYEKQFYRGVCVVCG
jgi:hypothetical protein